MWMLWLKWVLARPWIFGLIALTVLAGVQWTQINKLKGDMVDLRAEIVRIDKDYKTCKLNETSYISAIDVQKGSMERLNTAITALQEQLTAEQKTAEKWELKYKLRPVITKIKNVPVIEYVEKGVVVDEETSKQYVDYYNVLFSP